RRRAVAVRKRRPHRGLPSLRGREKAAMEGALMWPVDDRPAEPSDRNEPRLARLFAPRAVAVLGASEDPAKPGSRVLANVLDAGYAGTVHVVHARASLIQGLPCIPRPLDLPGGVDVAFVALPASATLDALEQLAAAGVRYAIVGSAGWAEGGDAE